MGWDIYEVAVSDDPHSRWAEIREQSPVLDAGDGVFFVTRWALVNEVLRDARHGAGAGVSASFGASEGLAAEAMKAWLMSLDGPPHARARGLVRREFTPRQIESLRPLIAQLAEELVGRIEAGSGGGELDLMPALAIALPSQVIRSLFGFTVEEWAESIEPIFTRGGPDARSGIPMIEAIVDFFDARMESGRIPKGLLDRLAQPDPELGSLSRLEIVANAVLLVTAAIDTTAGLIGNAIRCLLERPLLLGRVRREPRLVEAVVEETLRFEPPALSCSRYAAEPFTLGGVDIPRDSQLLLGLGAANRDPARYEHPNDFSLDRDWTGLLSFGGGRHFCLGAALARMEARVALERLLLRGRFDYDLVGPPVWEKSNPTVRALATLPVRPR